MRRFHSKSSTSSSVTGNLRGPSQATTRSSCTTIIFGDTIPNVFIHFLSLIIMNMYSCNMPYPEILCYLLLKLPDTEEGLTAENQYKFYCGNGASFTLNLTRMNLLNDKYRRKENNFYFLFSKKFLLISFNPSYR